MEHAVKVKFRFLSLFKILFFFFFSFFSFLDSLIVQKWSRGNCPRETVL